MSTTASPWQRYQAYVCRVPDLGLTLDISRMRFADDFFDQMAPRMRSAFEAMDALERGAIANPDEGRMVGHYWLRAPELAPTPQIAAEIRETVAEIQAFVARIHSGDIHPPTAPRFSHVLSIGIGGSALGPMLVADALGNRDDAMAMHFIDNTDPDGIARILGDLGDQLRETLVIVVSKSGGTPETRNGMLLVADAFRKVELPFEPHAVAITMPGSQLDDLAKSQRWLARFPMFDWVGGRTSVLSAVGLLPAALQGLDIDGLLRGAALCDCATRGQDLRTNPAALLALMWYYATDGHGRKDMVVLPYKDRLLLFSRYLQQLVMESLGKQLDRHGRRVEQGLTVYGNKGSTDQHAYVQQLRDGVLNFFVVFIRVLDASSDDQELEPGVTAGDYLHGFLLGTREALFDNGRESVTITVPRVNAEIVGGLIALFERAVGLYASLIDINAYHQPGVEAGKTAAASVLALQREVLDALSSNPQTAEQIATQLDHPNQVETIFLLLEHLAANRRARIAKTGDPGQTTFVQ